MTAQKYREKREQRKEIRVKEVRGLTLANDSL